MNNLMKVGIIIHAIAEGAIKACDYNLQDASDYLAEELPKAMPDVQPDILRGGKYLANELRRFGANQVLLCEQQISRSIIPETDSHGEVILTTAPDIVLATTKADTIIVLDAKTGWKERTNAEAKDEFQTCCISWILFGKYPQVETIHFFYLNTRKGTRSYARIDRNAVVGDNGLTQEMALQSRLFETARLFIDRCDEAWPEPTKCSMCPVIKWCKYAVEICKELEENVKLFIDNTIVMQEVLSRREKAIKDACKNGRILYGSCGRFDDSPKRKSPVHVSYKENKTKETESEAK